MNIRELLQIELWSKRTHRRLIVVFVVGLAGIFIWVWIDGSWLTAKERQMATSALAQIDGLKAQVFEEDQNDFDRRLQKTKLAVDSAAQVGSTGRDKQIALTLKWYFDSVMYERILRLRRMATLSDPGLQRQDVRIDAKTDQILHEEQVFNAETLHRTLNN